MVEFNLKEKVIDIVLSTFAKRKSLMIYLEIQKESFKLGLEKVRDFILENITIEDSV